MQESIIITKGRAMPNSLNEIAANMVKRRGFLFWVAGKGFVKAAPNECLCDEFANLIVIQDEEIKQLKAQIKRLESHIDYIDIMSDNELDCLED